MIGTEEDRGLRLRLAPDIEEEWISWQAALGTSSHVIVFGHLPGFGADLGGNDICIMVKSTDSFGIRTIVGDKQGGIGSRSRRPYKHIWRDNIVEVGSTALISARLRDSPYDVCQRMSLRTNLIS